MDIRAKFLQGVLGRDGASALRKAVQSEPRLEPIVLPRTIIGWLKFITQYEYEGELPGVENSYLTFKKSKDYFTGSIAIQDKIYNFENIDLYHLAGAISVSLDEKPTEVDEHLKDLILTKLGKSIDTLAKAQEVARNLQNYNINEDLMKTMAQIPPGKRITGGNVSNSWDYSHLVPPQFQKDLSIKLLHFPENPNKEFSGSMEVYLHHKNLGDIGQLRAYIGNGRLEPDIALIENPQFKGKGLGTAMYEALLAHGFHNGYKTVVGGWHSTEASRVHTKISQKHGLDYKPRPNERRANTPTGSFDGKFADYKYTLKQEEPMDKGGVDLPGKTHAPTPADGPIQPTPPTKQKSIPRMKLKTFKAPSLKIGKSESEKVCGFCGGVQFNNNKFTGCTCFRDLAKAVKTTVYGDGYALDFKESFDKEAYLVLSKYFRD